MATSKHAHISGGHRVRELDGLRGIAAVLVVFSHFTIGYDSKYPNDPPMPVDMGWGAYGVQLFFLISGFVILMSAQRAERPSDFVISRSTRLYPVYWVAVTQAIVVSIIFAVPHTQMGWSDRLLNYTMVQRLLMAPNVDEVYWTLTIEMQFYVLILALLFLTSCRISPRFITVFVTIWVGVSLLLAIVLGSYSRGIDPQLVWTPVKIVLNIFLVEWAPLFATGMLAFRARRDLAGNSHRKWLMVWAMGALSVTIHVILHGWENWLFVLGVVVAFLVVMMRRNTKFLVLAPFQWFGLISYSLYIGHAVVGTAVMHLVMPYVGRWGAMGVAFIVVVGNAALLHYTAETRGTLIAKKALLKWRRKWDERNRRDDSESRSVS